MRISAKRPRPGCVCPACSAFLDRALHCPARRQKYAALVKTLCRADRKRNLFVSLAPKIPGPGRKTVPGPGRRRHRQGIASKDFPVEGRKTLTSTCRRMGICSKPTPPATVRTNSSWTPTTGATRNRTPGSWRKYGSPCPSHAPAALADERRSIRARAPTSSRTSPPSASTSMPTTCRVCASANRHANLHDARPPLQPAVIVNALDVADLQPSQAVSVNVPLRPADRLLKIASPEASSPPTSRRSGWLRSR